MASADQERLLWALGGTAVAGALAYFLLRDDPAPAGSDPSLAGLPPWRQTMVQAAEQLRDAGTYYQWGGGRHVGDYGVDCSGLIIVAAKAAGVPLPPQGWTSTVWWNVLRRVTNPQPGDLAFFDNSGQHPQSANHVMMVTDPATNAGIGAQGGDSSVTTLAIAQAKNAMVRNTNIGPNAPHLLGYASMDPALRSTANASASFAGPVLCCD
jgi:NlpC/P60 family